MTSLLALGFKDYKHLHNYFLSLVGCGEPALLPNGELRVEGFKEGQFYQEGVIVEYTCIQDYRLEPVVHQRKCLKGRWSGQNPVCSKLPDDTNFKKISLTTVHSRKLSLCLTKLLCNITTRVHYTSVTYSTSINLSELPFQSFATIVHIRRISFSVITFF